VFKQIGFGALFEFISHFLDVVELFVNNTMQLFKITNNLSRSVNWVLNFQKVGDHGANAIVILGENRLENRKVVLGHLVSDLVENIDELGVHWILRHVKYWWLQTLGDHIVPVQDFLRENNKYGIDFLVVQEPGILKFKNFAHKEILVPLIAFLWILKKWDRVLIFIGDSGAEIGSSVVVLDPKSTIGIAFYNCYIIFLYNLDFYSYSVLGI